MARPKGGEFGNKEAIFLESGTSFPLQTLKKKKPGMRQLGE